MPERRRLALGILASGSGTNFDAIAAAIDRGELDADIAIVVCNQPAAAVVAKARALGVAVELIEHRAFPDRNTFDSAVADALERVGTELVVMAGFDRIVTSALLRRFPMRVINIHPALLPAFRGAHAQQQAADYGVTITGATVHFVDDDVDHGPIILQAAIPLAVGEDAETVRLRILEQEHRIFPYAIQLYAEGRLQVDGRRVRIRELPRIGSEALVSPPLPR